jgi:hypothetical protein
MKKNPCRKYVYDNELQKGVCTPWFTLVYPLVYVCVPSGLRLCTPWFTLKIVGSTGDLS